MLGNFSCFCCCLLTFFKANFFKKFFQTNYGSVKVISSQQKLPMARKELSLNGGHVAVYTISPFKVHQFKDLNFLNKTIITHHNKHYSMIIKGQSANVQVD